MKRILGFGFVLLLVSISAVSCGYSEGELYAARQEGYDEGLAQGQERGYSEGWNDYRTQYAKAEGSVIEYWAEYPDRTLGDYNMFVIHARVQNVGEDGAFIVKGEITKGDVDGIRSRSTKIFLERGEETNVSFSFWFKGRISYLVYCP